MADRLRDLYAHPVGRDALDKILLQLGRSRRWVRAVGWVPVSWLDRGLRRFTGPGFLDAFRAVLADHPVPDTQVHPAPRMPDAAAEVGPGGSADAGGWVGLERQPDAAAHPGGALAAAGGPGGVGQVGGEAAPGGGGVGQRPWWHDAVFYQVYPRSFADSDGDGVGDLRGILGRLDHLADLGVDCLWLSPIFDSPNEDMGYDVRDYRAVMAEMGTLADLDALVAGCHERGMRIILDLVVNHTSAEHAWFRAAVADPEGPYGSYYFLRPGEPGEDGSGAPPNNWTSFFGGSAWRWVPEARRWALHLFAPGQMDLNWENPAVRAEVADVVQWWLARGIDGFRLDVINYISKRPGLPDGNAFIGALMGFPGIEHYFFGPRLVEHLRELRERGFTRSGAPASTPRARVDGALGDPLPPDPVGVMVGETPGVGVETGRLLSGAGHGALDLVFNFDVLELPGRTRWDDYRYDLRYLKRYYVDHLERCGPGDRVALFVENHDNPRMVSKVLGSRAADPMLRAAVAKAIATVQLTLPGTPFLFQGQEIGAIDQDLLAEDLRDVESLNRLAELRAAGTGEQAALTAVLAGARDHARVPMRWEPGPATGFTTGTPWQVGREESVGFTVAEQSGDPDSVLAFHRELIALRRAHPALTRGSMVLLAPGNRDWFGYLRGSGGETWLVEVNLTGRRSRRPRRDLEVEVVLGGASSGGVRTGDGGPGQARRADRGRVMAPYEAVVARVV